MLIFIFIFCYDNDLLCTTLFNQKMKYTYYLSINDYDRNSCFKNKRILIIHLFTKLE